MLRHWLKSIATAMLVPMLWMTTSVSAQVDTLEEGLGVIVVTAQRRAENLQTTPVSVTALTSEIMLDRQIDGTLSVAAQVPNLNIEPVTALPNAARVFLRGVGEDQSTPTTDGAIGFYVDGVFLPRMQGAIFDFADVERVEVLRGPQGTLYGRNTSGGAVKIVTSDPGRTPSGSVDLTIGSYDRWQVRGVMGGPIGDAITGSVSFLKNKRDGNVWNTTLDRDVNRRDTEAVRGKLIWDVNESLMLKLIADWSQDRADIGVGASAFTGYPSDLFETAANGEPDGYLRTRGVALTASWAHGIHTISSISAYRDLENEGLIDNDGESRTIQHMALETRQKQFSQEITIASDWGRVQSIAGVYFLNERLHYDTVNYLGSRANPSAPVSALPDLTSQETDSYAVFGQASIAATDRLGFTLGGRFTRDKKDFNDRYPTLGREYNVDHHWTSFTGRLAVDYKLADATLLFASLSQGYKAGGFNRSSVAITALTPYDEEEVTTAEIGVKSDFFQHKLRTNMTLFHNDYDDLQLSAYDPATLVTRRFNAAAVTTKGVELEASALVTDGLTLYATAGYLDAKYDEFYDWVSGVYTDVSYRKLKGAPKWSGAMGASWEVPVTIVGSLRLNGNVSHRSRMENNIANTPIIASPSITLLDASLVWMSDDQHWAATLAGKNIANKKYNSAGLYIGGLETLLYQADKRTWSASVKYQF